MARSMLTLTEELFLLSIDDDRGKITSFVSGTLIYGLAGMLLAELTLQGRIVIKNSKLLLVNEDPTGDELLDEVLLQINEKKRTHKPNFWVRTIADRKLPGRVADRLVNKHILRDEGKRYLWVIPYEDSPSVDASAKYWVKHQLRSVVLAGVKPESGSILLLNLLKACRLLNLVFTLDEMQAANKKIDLLARGDVFGHAVARTIKEIETAANAAARAQR